MKDVLFKHRSIRKFRAAAIPAEVLRECLEAATRASTCGNMQLYSLVVTRDAALREQICAIAPGCWARIQARQEFMRKELGIQLPDEVLPLSDLQGVCFPYLADLNVVLACR